MPATGPLRILLKKAKFEERKNRIIAIASGKGIKLQATRPFKRSSTNYRTMASTEYALEMRIRLTFMQYRGPFDDERH